MDNFFKAYLNHNICDPGCENPAKVFIFSDLLFYS